MIQTSLFAELHVCHYALIILNSSYNTQICISFVKDTGSLKMHVDTSVCPPVTDTRGFLLWRI